jgi:hypothetical protein
MTATMLRLPADRGEPRTTQPHGPKATPTKDTNDSALFSVVRSDKAVVGLAVPHTFANSCSSCAHSTCSETNCKRPR